MNLVYLGRDWGPPFQKQAVFKPQPGVMQGAGGTVLQDGGIEMRGRDSYTITASTSSVKAYRGGSGKGACNNHYYLV